MEPQPQFRRGIGRYLGLLRLQAKVSLLSAAQYRWDFLGQGVMQILWTVMSAVPLLVAYGARAKAQGAAITETELGGWGLYPAGMVFGFFCLLKAILEGGINPSLTAVVEHIRKGTLDFVLLKPADAQFLVSTAKLEPFHLIDGLFAVAILVVTVKRHAMATGTLTVAHLLPWGAAALLLLVCALLILYSIWLLVACAAFYVVRIDNLSFLLTALFDFGRWPRTVWKGAFRIAFTFVLPLVVMTSFPVDAILGQLRWRDALWAVACPLVLLVLSRKAWKRALAGYTSASS